MKYLLCILLLASCRAPDRYGVGVFSGAGGSHTTSAGPMGGRTTAETGGAATAGIWLEGGIGKSESEKSLERIADAAERDSWLRADAKLKAEEAAMKTTPPPVKEAEPPDQEAASVSQQPTKHDEPAPDSLPDKQFIPIVITLLLATATAIIKGKHT